MGVCQNAPKTGNLVNFPRAQHELLEIEIYLLNRKIDVRPPEKTYSLTVIREVLYLSSFFFKSMGKAKRNDIYAAAKFSFSKL